MPFWSGETLSARGPAVIDPFVAGQIDCNSYTLRMGDQYYKTADQDQNVNELQRRRQLTTGDTFLIPPGQFAFLLSKEKISVPKDTMAFISMRTGIKLQGLINVSGFHVDPGYVGKLVYAVYNASPTAIQLGEGDLVFKIWFCTMDRESVSPFVFPPEKGIYEITNEMVRGMNREILSLQSLGKKLDEQARAIEGKLAEQKPVIENLSFIYRYLVLAVAVAAAIAILTLSLPTLLTGGVAFSDLLWSVAKHPHTFAQPQ